jgi:ACT domain-containing protein
MNGNPSDLFDFIDDDWMDAVVEVAKSMPDIERKHISSITKSAQRKNDTFQKMREMAARTRERRVR